MQKNNKTIIKYIAALFLCCAFVLVAPVIAKAGELTMHTINVLHGDAIVLESGGHYMLVDSGYAENSEMLMSYLEKLDIPEKNIDYVVATHPDGDHIGSMYKVYEEYNVANTILNDVPKPIKAYSRFINAIKEEGTPFHNPVDGETWTLGSAKIKVIYDGRQGTTYNESSIVLKVTIDNKSILLTADLPSTMEEKLIQAKCDLAADILKVGHHGAALSTSTQFLKKVKPTHAVISAAPYSADNLLPRASVLKRLAKVFAKTYRTTDGDIVMHIKNGVISTDHVENNPYLCITKGNVVLNSTLWTAGAVAGTAIKPNVSLFVNGQLMDPSKYSISYSDNTHTGIASVKVTGKENGTTGKLTGSLSTTFKILPHKSKFYSAIRYNTKVALHWNAQKTCSGYEIQYSTDKSFKTKVKKVLVKSGTTNKKTISKISKKKTYYFRVRSYTTNVGNGAWSTKAKIKKVKVKKVKVKKTKKKN